MAETLRLEVNGHRVRCLTGGADGPAVVLLHGGGVDSASLSWRHAAGALARGRRVFAPDWPGHGGSEEPGSSFDTEARVGFVGGLMDSLGLECAALVGLSLGGAAALGFALRSPERVEKLVLVDAYGLGGRIPRGRLVWLLAHAPLAGGTLFALLRRSHALTHARLRHLLGDVPEGLTEGLHREVRRELMGPAAGRAFLSFLASEVAPDGTTRTDFSGRLSGLRVPALLVHGERDGLVPVGLSRREHGLIPGSELAVMQGCGHWTPRERPEEFERIVGGFLAGRRPGTLARRQGPG